MKTEHLSGRSAEIFRQGEAEIHRQTDRLFAWLMAIQWVGGIVIALLVSPRAWAGRESYVHPHLLAAVFLGGLISAFPIAMAWLRPGARATRQIIAIGQMLTSVLLIHLTGGRIETHFLIFGSLAFLAVYRDWRVLATASAVAAVHHLVGGIYWPQSVFGVANPNEWRWLEHAAWVLFEDAFLLLSMHYSRQSMRLASRRQAEMEALNERIEQIVVDRTHELADAKNTVQMILDGATQVAIIGVDHAGLITVFNPGAESMLGYSAAEVVGKKTPLLFHLESEIQAQAAEQSRRHGRCIEGCEVLFSQARDGRAQEEKEWTYLRRDGGRLAVTLQVTPLRSADGVLTGFLGIAKDITERRRAEKSLRESEERFRQVAENINQVFWLTTPDFGHFLYINPAYEQIYGRTRDSIYADAVSWIEAVTQEDRPAVLNALAQTREGHPFEVEYRIARPQGDIRWIRTRAFPIHNEGGSLIRLCGMSEDITERKQITADLEDAQKNALEATRLKSQFLANMSHEIRSPMNGVLGMGHLLMGTSLDPDQRECVETICSSAESLLTVINDILDFSKIEAGKLEFETLDFELHEVVESTLEVLAGHAQAKGLDFAGSVQPGSPTWLRGDPGRLRQVLTNLVTNAVKFTARGGVSVRVEPVAEDETHATLSFSVTDTGIGIPPEAQARLFEAFSQADGSTTRKYGGTGLGLAISKQLVEQMGGSIRFTTQPELGSTFSFTVCLAKQTAIRPVVEGDSDVLKARVLIVENETMSGFVLREQLAAWGMRFGGARTGASALEELRHASGSDPYAITLIDSTLPDLDGILLARAIKSDPLISATRVILLTEFGKRPSAEEMKAAGIVDCRCKPVRQSTLFDCLVAVVHGSPRDPAGQVESERSPEARPERILLAEDSAINQNVAVRQLRKLGYHSVDVAANGLEVLEAVERISYDIVLMDCQMPEMDGYQAAAEIRQRETNGTHLRIIAMTANSMAGDREKCLEAGMDDYVSKPVRIDELAAALQRSRRSEPIEPVSDDPDRNPIDPASLETLQSLSGDGEDVVAGLIEMFLQEAPATFQRLQEAIDARDVKGIAAAAHLLKSNAGHFGAHDLQGLCAGLEAAARTNQIDETPARLRLIAAELPCVISALQSHLNLIPV